MAVRGLISHVDMSVRDPSRSIPFYAAFFTALGFRGVPAGPDGPGGPDPQRAGWSLVDSSGAWLNIEVRPAEGPNRDRVHDRYAPGLHHLAFHADSREDVDRVHAVLAAQGLRVTDPPAEYPYSEGYYAVFFADPDGVKLEVVYEPVSNPG